MSTKARQLSKILAPGGAIADGSIQATKISGIVSVESGGTNAATALAARSNLGLAIGSNVQRWHSVLDNLIDLQGSSGILKKSGALGWALDNNQYITGNQTITFSGDVSGSGATSVALTLANSGVTAGTYGSATTIPQFVVDAKGRITSVSTVTVSVTKSDVGLGLVDNKSSDTIRGELTSTNVTTALGYTPESTNNRGVANGYATLDATGKVPSIQLPSYVDDVLEFATLGVFPGTGETGKIYVAIDTNKTYRWSGATYIEISASPGTTDSLVEGSTNLYYTNTRARNSLSFTAGSGAYNSITGTITIPTNTNQLTNGAGFISSNQLITVTGDAIGTGTTSINLTLANSGAASGTYGSTNSIPVITVDAKGRVTSVTTAALASVTGTTIIDALGYTPVTQAELEDVRALALAGL